MRVVIPGFALAALGFQTILSSFFCQHARDEAKVNSPSSTSKPAEFDGFAADYDAALNKGISLLR